MKTLNLLLSLGGALALLHSSSSPLAAQDNPPVALPRFDPKQMMQQFQQRMMERYREQLGVTNDGEWKIIEERIAKVQQARMEMMSGGPGFMGFGGPGGGRGGAVALGVGPGAGGGSPAVVGPGSPGGVARPFQGMFPEPSPEAAALQKAVEAKAPAADIKEKLAQYRALRKQKQDSLQKAQDALRAVLTASQEATLVLNAVLD